MGCAGSDRADPRRDGIHGALTLGREDGTRDAVKLAALTVGSRAAPSGSLRCLRPLRWNRSQQRNPPNSPSSVSVRFHESYRAKKLLL